MHLIDFEQLKMENVTLREKIEERGDEVTRLRKKTNATVQARLALLHDRVHGRFRGTAKADQGTCAGTTGT